jgi:hypothetical protein
MPHGPREPKFLMDVSGRSNRDFGTKMTEKTME